MSQEQDAPFPTKEGYEFIPFAMQSAATVYNESTGTYDSVIRKWIGIFQKINKGESDES